MSRTMSRPLRAVRSARSRNADDKQAAAEFLAGKRVWMHRGAGPGSVSRSAADYGRQHGITVIEGGCPCMFDPTADPGHKAHPDRATCQGAVPTVPGGRGASSSPRYLFPELGYSGPATALA